MPCNSGYLRANARLAVAASAASRTLARIWVADPVTRPPNVDGATATIGLLRIRFIFPVVSHVRTYARAPSTTILIGVLTGHNGAFARRLTFASGAGKIRRVYSIDADGNGARALSPEDETALAPAFGKDQEIYYASSKQYGEYRLRSESGKDRPLPVRGSVYGLSFD